MTTPTTTTTPAPTLATGAKLDAATWADFTKRLHHHCRGEGVEWHSTAYALFVVQRRVYVTGLDLEYAQHRCLIDHDGDTRAWRDIASCIADLDEDMRALVDKQVAADFGPDEKLENLSELTQWEVIAEATGYTMTGWDEQWEFVGAHFTREAADAFIKRKGHDYRDGLRVYVDAQPYAWEFEAVKDGIMDGRIGLLPSARLSDDDIVKVWQGMPGGPDGWLKDFGFIQFARAVLAAAGSKSEGA